MDLNQKQEYTEGIDDYLEEYNVYDYFYELMKEIIVNKPKNPIDFLIERISKTETKRCVIVGPPGFSQLGLGRLIAGKIGWKYLNMSDWIERDIDEIRKSEAAQLPQPRPPKVKKEKKKSEEIKEEPSKEEPPKEEPSKKEPSKKEPSKENSSKEDPPKEETKDEDIKEDPKKEKKDDKSQKEESQSKADDHKSGDENEDEKDSKNEEAESKDDQEKDAKDDKETHDEEEKPKQESPPPPKTHILELEANLERYKKEALEDDSDEDVNNHHLFDDIVLRNNEKVKEGFISDDNSIKVFSKNAKEFGHESWILEGFPKTKSQGLALGKNKIIPDKIFLLKYSDEVALEHIMNGIKEKHSDKIQEEEMKDIAQRIMQEYHLQIKDVEQMFKNVIHIIDAHGYVKGYSDDQNKASNFVDQISSLILMKRTSPHRKLRVIVIGAPGSGRSTQAEKIAEKYKLVHVSTSNLLQNEIRLGTEKGKRINDCFKNNKLVPDEIICSLVENRIKKDDCIQNGWILDGFPKTIQQITVLKAIKIKPTRVIILECDKEICVTRIVNRQYDPVTGQFYNTELNPSVDPEIRERLKPLFPDMNKDKVEKRWNIWNQFQIKVQENYQDLALKFNTEEYTPEQVTEQICEYLENPLF
ncbi:unnamed protein product [Moneuplotes crassus]|uniref:Adenylate kinase n=1 Tax=Euplotes crassus TaxID=5936 RepID=A0AAD1X5K2_EUPCR|nr:unnamed protein product [Moneuplotes crassus]